MRYSLFAILSLAILGSVYAQNAEVRDLIGKLTGKDNTERRRAAEALAELGPDAKLAVPALTKALRDRDLFVRRYSAQALGKIGTDARDAITALALATGDEAREVQLAAIESLCQLGKPALSALLAVVKDPGKVPQVRKKAALGLAAIGPSARSAVPALTDILTGKAKTKKGAKDMAGDDMRVDVAVALGKVSKPEDTQAVEALKAIVENKKLRNQALKKAASAALREINGMPPARGKKK